MYEQISHSLLNDILDDLHPEISKEDLRHFYTRLGANFYAIYTLFFTLYGQRDDFKSQMLNLVETLARQYIARPDNLQALDVIREDNHTWFLSQELMGMALYSNGFADGLRDLSTKISYLQELGINFLHVMPILQCPQGKSDGGYAVSDFREIDARVGSLSDLRVLSEEIKKRDMLLVLDIVLNHTSDEHQWAKKAKAGETQYQDYYYCFKTREIPDMFEQTMLEIFPEIAPGNFTWNPEMQQWVMTVFHQYQWDLNYTNPAVFIEMLDIILFWANQGVDVMRLDAVAFLWKKIGTMCQNEHEAHLLLQLFKDCCQVVAPGVLFIAEAIVAPVEIIKYFGEDAVIAKECEIAYNATFMALLWDAVATKNSKLLYQGLKSLPHKLDRATWLNYVRCHDDIGFGFDDNDIRHVGYEPHAHRQFLVDYYSGQFEGSPAKGSVFMYNPRTGDARISGSLASLIGLQRAIEQENLEQIDLAIKKILLLHSLILSFGGIPLLYYGDEIGTLNDCSYLEDSAKADDNRWMHRPKINWNNVALRNQQGTIEYKLFQTLKKMIAVRKSTPAFADFNNRELIETDNPHLFGFIRSNHQQLNDKVLVVCNFNDLPQYLDLSVLEHKIFHEQGRLRSLCSGRTPAIYEKRLVLSPYQFEWLNVS